MFSFKGRLYIFFYAQSRCATGSPPLFLLLLLPILFFCVSFFYSITLTKMFYYFRPHQSDPATLIFFTRGGPPHPLGPSESKWATRLSLTNFWHNKKTLDEMLADDLREREEPPTLFTRQSVFKKTQVVHPFDCFLFPFWFLFSRLRPKRINEHSEKKKELLNVNLFFSPHYIPSSGVKRESKKNKNRQHNFFHFPVEKKKCREFTNSTQKNKIVNSVIESSIHPSV